MSLITHSRASYPSRTVFAQDIRAWLVAALGALASLSVFADAHADVTWSGSLAVTSDYIQQGLSQTRSEPAIQGGLRAQLNEHWTFGTWASTIDRYRGSGANTEIDLYLARAWRFSPDWIAALTATHYFFPGDTGYIHYDYDEVTASVGYRSAVFATVAWSPNYSDVSYRGAASDRTALSYELSVTQPLFAGWSGNAGVGYRDLSDLFDEQYWYGHGGLMYSAKRLTVHLTYTYVDANARELFGHERTDVAWSGTVIWRFGHTH